MRLIDADRLRNIALSNRDMEMVYEIDHSPTVERPHGEWIEKPWGVVCSRCKAQALHTPNGNQSRSDFCPDCGADMREGEAE